MVSGGDVYAGYSLEKLAGGEILRMRLWGRWTGELAGTFDVAFRTLLRAMNGAGYVVVDAVQLPDTIRGELQRAAVKRPSPGASALVMSPHGAMRFLDSLTACP
jgi:hypothetical protein